MLTFGLSKIHKMKLDDLFTKKGAANVRQGGAVYVHIKNIKGNARRLFANRMVPRID